MKKQLFLLAALVISAMTFATTITINGASGFKSSYPKKDGVAIEQTITVGEVGFTYMNIQYSGKGSPSAAAAASKSFIQMKGAKEEDVGKVYLHNAAALTMKYIQIYTFNDAAFTISAGADLENLAAIEKPTGKAGTVKVVDKDDATVEKDVAVVIYTFNIDGKAFFKLDNNEDKPHYIYQIVLTDEEIKEVHPEKVELDKETATLAAFETLQLTATVLPENAQNKSVTWSSSDEEIATVDENGLVTAWAAGTADITVTTVDGEKTATCKLTVAPAKKSDFGKIRFADLKDKDTVIITMTVDSVGVPMVLDASGASSAGPKGIAGGIVEGTIVPATDNVVFIAHINADGIHFVPKGHEEIDSIFLYVSGAPSNNDGVRVKKIGKNDNVGDRWIIDAETGYLKATYTYHPGEESEEEITRYLGVNEGTFKAYKLDSKGKISSKIKDEVLKLFVKGAEPPVEYYFKMTWAAANSTDPIWAPAMDGTDDEMPEAWVAANYWTSEDILVNTKPSDEGALKFVHEGGTAETQIIYVNMAENCVDCSAEPAPGTLVAVVYCTPAFTITNLAGHLIVMYEYAESIENINVDAIKAEKVLIDGQLYIIRDGAIYSVQGIRVK